MADFVIPELGEGVAGGDVVRVMVKPGDALKKDQPVLELETDKATIEVPSNVAGVVKELKIKTGDKVKVGQVVLTVDEGAAAAPAKAPAAAATADKSANRSGEVAWGGTGQGAPAAQSPPIRRPPSTRTWPALNRRPARTRTSSPSKVVDIGRGTAQRPAAAAPAAGTPMPGGGGLVPAAPSTRRTARELGVDITAVEGSGPGGRISVDDVKGHARSVLTGSGGGGSGAAGGPLPDFSQWGEVEVQPMRNIRRVPPSGCRRRGPRFRTSPSATRPTSPSWRTSGRSTRSRRRRPAASSPSPRLR